LYGVPEDITPVRPPAFGCRAVALELGDPNAGKRAILGLRKKLVNDVVEAVYQQFLLENPA